MVYALQYWTIYCYSKRWGGNYLIDQRDDALELSVFLIAYWKTYCL